MRGIILAGGSGTRLRPLTRTQSKQLLPVFDKPLIYYPLSLLMLMGIREILIISTPEHVGQYRSLFGDGGDLGIRVDYAEQDRPRGLADALVVGREFVGDEQVALILGDNIFHGHDLVPVLREQAVKLSGATLFGYPVADPERYGVAVLDSDGGLVDIEEKPERPRSSLAVTGLYLYDNDALDYAAELTPSARGELEITDVNRRFVREGRARLVNLGRGTMWLDAGTHETLLEAANYVRVLQSRQGVQIACVEEVAHRMGMLDGAGMDAAIARVGADSDYGRHLVRVRAEVSGGPDAVGAARVGGEEGGPVMRVAVDQGVCIGSGQCTMITDRVFGQREDDGVVTLEDEHPPVEEHDLVRTAAVICPVSAISVSG
ncbi:glucose-1-phosphate thymidylyltransferase [Nocardiopsis sp. Huas11]|nr:glucose-1-phosphate thymidylyltransferase [Nocardiopsis sp. Huas11]